MELFLPLNPLKDTFVGLLPLERIFELVLELDQFFLRLQTLEFELRNLLFQSHLVNHHFFILLFEIVIEGLEGIVLHLSLLRSLGTHLKPLLDDVLCLHPLYVDLVSEHLDLSVALNRVFFKILDAVLPQIASIL